MRLAWQNLIQERTRLALSVLGVALAILLILVLQGFLRGMFRQIAAYLEHSPGSVVVAQDGVVNLFDYDTFQTCLTGPGGGPLPAGCNCYDFDADGVVTLEDFATVQEMFNGQ